MAGSYSRSMFNYSKTAKLFSKAVMLFSIPTRSV